MDIELDIEQDYPFRKSLTKTARCGMCKYARTNPCIKGHTIHYPLISNEHNCPDYQYKPDTNDVPEGFIVGFMTNQKQFPECQDCSHNYKGLCDGIKHYPYKTNPCEFFRPKNLTCKFAVPYKQYGNDIRNNYCSLEPEKRDNQGHYPSWHMNCPWAHEASAKHLKCYQPNKDPET